MLMMLRTNEESGSGKTQKKKKPTLFLYSEWKGKKELRKKQKKVESLFFISNGAGEKS